MSHTFSFSDVTRYCRSSFLADSAPQQQRLDSLRCYCLAQLDQYHPARASMLDCRAGCGTCCSVNVSVLLPEALAIVDYLESQPGTIQGIKVKLDSLWIRIRGIDDEDRVCMRQPCAFLDDVGACSIYPVRPLLCRGVTSTDVESCRQSFNAFLFNQTLGVQMNLFQRDLYAAAYLGLSEALVTLKCDARGFELTGIVRYLLHNPQQRSALHSGLCLTWNDLA
ncbi:YkgJ family cysteine cluster protein [Geopsychrobacter electrodiphilus]|uniref:YkgJ family cysteine cluster protein n=1 Tax=Geopsychrobacter electrodiphilus TaxID=225196 RepID=UPI00038221EF|nr:YkgJ family cysteine cluster protein [Geopsychrobacter electrodiphilus]